MYAQTSVHILINEFYDMSGSKTNFVILVFSSKGQILKKPLYLNCDIVYITCKKSINLVYLQDNFSYNKYFQGTNFL